jgi:hypothetical protein
MVRAGAYAALWDAQVAIILRVSIDDTHYTNIVWDHYPGVGYEKS